MRRKLGCVVASLFVAVQAGAQDEVLTPPERSWIPMMGMFSPRFASELLADNDRARMALRGEVEKIVTYDLTDAEAGKEDGVKPDYAVIWYDEHGQTTSASFVSSWGEPLHMIFETTKLDDGYKVASEGGFATSTRYYVEDGRVSGYDVRSMLGSCSVRVADRFDDDSPKRVTVKIEEGEGSEVEFDTQGRVAAVKAYQQTYTYTWGKGTLTVVDQNGKQQIHGTIDEHGNLIGWTMLSPFADSAEVHIKFSSEYTYDAHGNWVELRIRSVGDEGEEDSMSFKRKITYRAGGDED